MPAIDHLHAAVGQNGRHELLHAVVADHVVAVHVEDIVARGGVGAGVACR